jgi:hypothetical protein
VSDGQGGFRPRYRVSAVMLTQIGVVMERSRDRNGLLPSYQGAQPGLPAFGTSLS